MMKKISAVLVAFFLMIAMISQMVSAQATVTFSAGSLTHDGVILKGEEITVPLYVRSMEAFCMLQFELHFDPAKWEAVGKTEEAFMTTAFSTFHNVNITPTDTKTGEPIEGCVVIGGMALTNSFATEDTLLATVTLKARCDITQEETLAVKPVKAGAMVNKVQKECPCAGVDGGVVIQREAPEQGDINEDGAVSLPDATLLFYIVNGLSDLTAEQQITADMDGDGTVTLNDATKLFYQVNGLM